MNTIRVLIADDHAILRSGLKLLIGAQSDMVVVGEAGDGAETVRVARVTGPDIVISDLTMPGSRGTQTIEELARLSPRPRILILTMHDDPAYMRSAIQAGASGYVVKKAADVELLVAIRAVYNGRTFVDLSRPGAQTAVGAATVPGMAAVPAAPLSARETEVIRLVARGHTNKEAAQLLGVSTKTVETHRKRLSDKLSLKSRAELYRFAVESGLIEHAAATGA